MSIVTPAWPPDTLDAMRPAVACEGLSKRFGSTVAVDAVTLDAAPGEILALLGPSGCGKTTFLRLIAGFESADGGRVELDGVVVAGRGVDVPPEKRRVGFVFQDYALFPHLTIGGNVGFGLSDRAARAARVAEVLRMVGLEGFDDRYPHELSGGQQQRVALARALAPAPRLILLDEPFSNLDADLRARVRGEVREILRAAGATAIFVTHDQDEAFDIADRLAVMHEGRIEQLGPPEHIYHTPQTRFVADFVGDADLLPFTLDEGHLSTEIGSFAVASATVEPGPGELLVRPEDIRITADPEGDAIVVARRFQGPVNMTVVRLASGNVVTSAHSSQVLFLPGQRVRARLDPDHLVLFRGQRCVASLNARAETGTDQV